MSYKPVLPTWIKIALPLIKLCEAAAVAVGLPALTGLSPLLAVALYLTLNFFFQLTPIPAVLTPFAVLGAASALGLPWWLPATIFLIPHMYSLFFLHTYHRQTAHLSPRFKSRRQRAAMLAQVSGQTSS